MTVIGTLFTAAVSRAVNTSANGTKRALHRAAAMSANGTKRTFNLADSMSACAPYLDISAWQPHVVTGADTLQETTISSLALQAIPPSHPPNPRVLCLVNQSIIRAKG